MWMCNVYHIMCIELNQCLFTNWLHSLFYCHAHEDFIIVKEESHLLLTTFFVTTGNVLVMRGFLMPMFRMGSLMFLKSADVSGLSSSASWPLLPPTRTVRARMKKCAVGFILEDSAADLSRPAANLKLTVIIICELVIRCQFLWRFDNS